MCVCYALKAVSRNGVRHQQQEKPLIEVVQEEENHGTNNLQVIVNSRNTSIYLYSTRAAFMGLDFLETRKKWENN